MAAARQARIGGVQPHPLSFSTASGEARQHMPRHRLIFGLFLLTTVLRARMADAAPDAFPPACAFPDGSRPPALRATLEKLTAGQPVTVVCLGDSVTGVYYHTGGRRAYPEMLELALRAACEQARVRVLNAGISGHKSADGLKRLQSDVLDHHPDLVTVMFGLNDLTALPLADFRANLTEIAQRCRAADAAVILCTPNSVIDTPGRPIPKLVEYCQAVQEVAAKQQIPVCDVYGAFETVRTRNPLAWRLLLSDEIHPNMDGHKLTAETLCRTITGRDVSLREVGPPQPLLPKMQAMVKAGRPVRVLAMEPLDLLVAPAIRAVLPAAVVEVQPWPTAGQTLAQIEAAAQRVRQAPPDLVVIAIPASVTPADQSPSEESIRTHSWILNWSLSFGRQEWDVVVVAPSVFSPDPTPAEQAADAFSRKMGHAQDLPVVARQPGDSSPPACILEAWFRTQCAFP